MCIITGSRKHSSGLDQVGLQIPCTLCFTGDKNWLKKLARLFNCGWCRYVHSSSSVKLELVELECKPVNKEAKLKIITTTADDNQASSNDLENGVWVKCDKYILRNEDKEIIETGSGGLCSTLLQSRQKSRLPENSLQAVPVTTGY